MITLKMVCCSYKTITFASSGPLSPIFTKYLLRTHYQQPSYEVRWVNKEGAGAGKAAEGVNPFQNQGSANRWVQLEQKGSIKVILL